MRRIACLSACLFVVACADTDQGREGTTGDTAADRAPSAAPEQAATPSDQPITATLDEWSVQLSAQEVRRGTVSISVRNEGTLTHALEVEGQGEEWESGPIPPGESVLMTVVLEPGEYEVYCPVTNGGNHKARGMVTRLVVR